MADPGGILLVDDDEELAATLREILERDGYAVTVAHTGAAASRVLRDAPPSLVLLDLRLPDMDGVELMREIRRLDAPPELIVATGHATLESAIVAVEAGAAGYVLKPLDLGRLAALVGKVLERRRLARENAWLSAELAERLRESEALLAVSTTISSTLDLREALRRLCRELVRLLAADTGAAYVHDPGSDLLVPYAAYRVPKEHLAVLASATLPLHEQGFHLPIWRERRPVFSDDVAGDTRFSHEMFRRFHHQSGLLLPLVLGDAVAGAFYLVWWTERRRFTERELQLVQTVAGQVALLLRNARLYEAGERDRHGLAALNEVSRRLAAVHEPEETLSLIVNEATRLLGADAAGIRLLEGDDLVVAARTESAAAIMARPRLKVGESLTGAVVATGGPVAVEDLIEDTRYDPAHKRGAIELGFHGFLGVPLRARDRITGALNVYTKTRRRFAPSEVSLLAAFADQASLAIEKGRLYQEARVRQRQAEELARVARALTESLDFSALARRVVDAVLPLFGARSAGFRLLRPDGSLVAVAADVSGAHAAPGDVLAPGMGISGRVVAEGRAVSCRDLLSDPGFALDDEIRHRLETSDARAFLAVPLRAKDRVIGALSIADRVGRVFTEPEVTLLQTFADQAAMALENAGLYAETKQREEEATRLATGLRLLNQASRALYRTLDVDAMLGGALEELAAAFGAAAALVNLFEDAGGIRSVGRWVSDAHGRAVAYRAKGGITEIVRETRRPLLLRDIAERRDIVHPAHFEHGVRSLAAFPVVGHGERVLGALFLYYTTPQAFPDSEIQLLGAYADQLGTALENAQLYEEARTQRRRLREIFDSTSDGIIRVGRDGRIQAANRRAEELLAFSGVADALAGRETPGVAADPGLKALRAVLDDPDRGGEGDLEVGAARRILHWVARPTKDAAGATVGVTLTFQDVTQEREVSRMKSEFVSFVTHQLRTPLSGIKWLLELAAEETGVPEEPRSYIRDARDANERLIGLVNDLLNASRLESGRLTVALQPTDLGALTRRVLEEVGPLVREKGHRVSVDGAEALPRVAVDPRLMREAILNLVSNALKYTLPGGEIAIRMGAAGTSVRWAIQDSGVGIPKHAQARLFEKFFRGENVLAIETEGTGLGLYLVRLIVERFGGRIWCESDEGKGAMFVFTLPLAEAPR